jgi:HEAT repeat protein
VLSRVLRVQSGEGRTVALLVALMFTSVAGQTIGESGISALFFERIGPDALPVMYLAQGVVGILGMLVLTGILGRFDRRRAYVTLPIVLAVVVALERAIVAADPAWIYRALWLTTTVAMLVNGVCLWGTAGLVTDTRRAKRLFPLFGAGSILGAVAGGLGTRPLASAVGAENLLVVWAIALLAASAVSAAILGVRRKERRPRLRSRRPSAVAELREGFRFVRRSPLLIWMSIASILFSVLYYSLYLPFAQAVTVRYPDPDALAGFFGVFWAAVTAAAFVVSVLLANRLLGWFGAAVMVLVLPFLYAGTFGVLLVTSTFGMLVALRFGVSVWLQGVSSTAWETLVNVAPEHRRDQTRAFLNGGPAQVGTAIAGVVQLVGRQALTSRQLSAIGLIVAAITIVVAWRIRGSYTTALVAAIRAGRPRVFDEPVPNSAVRVRHDAQAVALAAAAMDDADPRMRRMASELLASAVDARATEALRAALDDPDALVRANAVGAFAAESLLAGTDLDRALSDADPQVRRAAIRALDAGDMREALLRDDDPAVAAAAAVRLLKGHLGSGAADALRRLLADEDAETRLLAVKELRNAAPDDVATFAIGGLDDPSPGVRAAALEALAAAGPEVAVPAALGALTSAEPAVRRAALDALDLLDLSGFEDALGRVVEEWSSLAASDRATVASVPDDGAAWGLLEAALVARGRARALVALSAASVTSDDRDAMRVALDILRERDAGQLANALETIEFAAPHGLRPLLGLWEPTTTQDRARVDGAVPLEAAAADDDPFIRACAELVRSNPDEGGTMSRSQRSMSPMELVLVLRRIPLFSALEPAEVQRVAAIADERTYADGEVVGAEGELGDEMHVVLDGTVGVVRSDGEMIARRGAGDVVGEMSLITRSPRVASLIAEGDVRTIRIGRREFEAMVRERPEIALAIMRVLAERLGAMTNEAVADRV